MYVHETETSWSAHLFGSARTLAAIVLTALLASALTVRWSDAAATSAPTFVPMGGITMAGVPVSIEGAVVGAGDGLVALVEKGSQSPVAFPVVASASVLRDGQSVSLDALRPGDQIRMTIDGASGQVLRLHAETVRATAFPVRVPGAAALLAALGLIVGATALTIRNASRLPAIPARFLTTRLQHAGAMR